MNPDTDKDNCVDRDVSCVTCGYNLRGLQEEGRCPECGEKVSDTLGNVLAMADRKLLVELRKTVTVLAIVRIVFVSGVISKCLPIDVGDIARGAIWLSMLISGAILFIGLLGLAGVTWDVLGVRPLKMHYVVFVLVRFVLLSFPAALSRLGMDLAAGGMLVMLPLIFEAATCGYVERIARRGGNDSLSVFAMRVKWFIGFLLAVVCVGALSCQIYGTYNPSQPFVGLWDFIGIVAISFVGVLNVVFVLDAVILWRMRRMLTPYCAVLS